MRNSEISEPQHTWDGTGGTALTLYHKVLTRPAVGFREQGGINTSSRLPIRPVVPRLTETCRKPELFSTKCLMLKRVLSTRVTERSGIIISTQREDHDIVSKSFPQQQMIDGLDMTRMSQSHRN